MGRPRNSPNKVTKEVREKFQKLVENQLETLEEDFKSLPARERIKYTLEMAKYVIPQLRAVEAQIVQANSEPVDFNGLIKQIKTDGESKI